MTKAQSDDREQAVLRAKLDWECTFDALPDLVAILDGQHRITRVNRAMARRLGLQPAQCIGMRCHEAVHGLDAPPGYCPHSRTLADGSEHTAEVHLDRLGGDFLVSTTPLRHVTGVVHIARDITHRKQAEEALRESEARLRRSQEIAHLGSWELDVVADRLTWSDEVYRIFGLEPQEFGATYEAFLAAVHPDDRAAVDAAYSGSLRAGQDSYELVHRVCRPSGEVRTVHEKCEHVRDPDGRVIRSIGMVHDITARKQAEDELRRAARRKDEFLAMLSHELRNPLAPIRTSTYILRHAEPGSAQAERARTVIERQAEHLTRLVDELLDVTRIERGRIELRLERVDLCEVVRRTAEDFRATIEENGVALHVRVPHERIWAHADATRVAQIVGNLLHNAAKYTRRGDEVAVSVEPRANDIEIAVRDTGAGIAPELLPDIFAAFVQGERTLARSEGGLGLGLAVVKGIAELHGGSVGAASAGEGHGAELVIRLPAARPAEVGREAHGLLVTGEAAHRVLVVDDNVDAATSLADLLAMRGHTVEVAHDGRSAVEKARANPPQVVLCDVGLSGRNGHEIARALRDELHADVQLIAMGACAQPEDVRYAIEAGFDGHLAKPCDPEEIERLMG